MVEIVVHLLDHVTRHLRPARPVEIGDRIAVVDAFESREVSSDIDNG
jgi:hypothetical protein